MLSRGDFIYYDWSGDGVWDHVAVVAGTNSAGQKVIDAHTTDHYRVYWKLGCSSTKYRYAQVRAWSSLVVSGAVRRAGRPAARRRLSPRRPDAGPWAHEVLGGRPGAGSGPASPAA